MRILIDIGHPGHVHYFRNMHHILIERGHRILVFARDKEVTFDLLNFYRIPFISRGKGKKSLFGKLIYLVFSSLQIFLKGYKFKPQITISFASPYASLAAFFLRSANIILDDTEVGRFERYIYKPLADLIITPNSFRSYLGKNHYRFDGFMELAYLNSKYFKPDYSIINKLGLSDNEKYVIIRFVSWEATHDIGQHGLTIQQKHEIVKLLNGKIKIFISSERKLPESLEEFRLKLSPSNLHNALFFASLYIGEGATTASEACVLGTPAIYINSISNGYTKDQENSGMLFNFRNYSGVPEQIELILKNDKRIYSDMSSEMVKNKIDLTSLLVWLIEEYPLSKRRIIEEPKYQYRFKHPEIL